MRRPQRRNWQESQSAASTTIALYVQDPPHCEYRTSSLLRRTGIHIRPPPRQLLRHCLQSLRPCVLVRRVVVRLVIISLVCVCHSRPLLHGKDVCRGIHLRLVVQPCRHVSNRHVIPIRIAITRLADYGIHARCKCYLSGRSFAEEFCIDMDAFAVNLLDVFGGIRRVAGVEVPADAEQVAWVELYFLAFEGIVDSFGDVSLQAGHVTVLHPRDSRFPEDRVKMRLSTCVELDLRFGKCGGHERKVVRGRHDIWPTDSLKGCNDGVARGQGYLTRSRL